MSGVTGKPAGHDLWRDTVERPVREPLSGTGVRVDVAVIGAGLTGLAAALHLARSGRSVAVLEAGRVGAGASGISTGIVGPGVGGPISLIRKKFGDQQAAAMFRYSQDGVDATRKLVSDNAIDCDLVESTHLLAARTKGQLTRLRRDVKDAADLGLDVPLLDADEVAATLGHRHYHGALAYRPVVTVNPLKLTLGVAAAAEQAGVTVFEQSAVTGLTPHDGGTRVEVGGRSLQATTVIVATDGYSPDHLPHGKRIARLRTHVLATRVLTDAERAGLGWGGREGVIDQRTFFNYYRTSPDGRLILGGGPVTVENAGPRASQKVWKRLERELAQLFPSLAGVPVEYRWSGLTGVTLDMMPVVGDVPKRPGVIYAGAWLGHGLSLAVANGVTLAANLKDDGSGLVPEQLPWHRSTTRTPPMGPFQPLFVGTYVRALDTVDKLGTAVGGKP